MKKKSIKLLDDICSKNFNVKQKIKKIYKILYGNIVVMSIWKIEQKRYFKMMNDLKTLKQ
jgi:hypothetical protein